MLADALDMVLAVLLFCSLLTLSGILEPDGGCVRIVKLLRAEGLGLSTIREEEECAEDELVVVGDNISGFGIKDLGVVDVLVAGLVLLRGG